MKKPFVASFLYVVVCISVFTFFSSNTIAQNTSSQLNSEWDGTYQFIMKTKMQVAFSTDIVDFIEKNRSDNDDIIIQYSELVEIYILSRKKIQTPGFKPFSEAYIYSK